MTELILGTAEFNPKGYADRPCPDEKEIARILNRAFEKGIKTLDTADSYGCSEIIHKNGARFDYILKTRDRELLGHGDSYCYHYQPGEANQGVRFASVYDVDQLHGCEAAIIPVSINHITFLSVKSAWPSTVYIRSVFDRGRLLQQGYSVKDCLSFVARHNVTGIIVGVSSEKELEEILVAWKLINTSSK